MPGVTTKVSFWQTNEGKKDICMIAGGVLDLLNAYSPHIPPGILTASGIILGRVINIFGNPDATTVTKVVSAFFLGLFLMGSPVQAQETDLVAFPVAVSDNLLAMGNGIFKNIPAPSFGYSLSVAEMTGNSVNKSIGLLFEGQIADGVNPGENALVWTDLGPIVSVDGFAFKCGFQTSGSPQGQGIFIGGTFLIPVPGFLNNLKIKL